MSSKEGLRPWRRLGRAIFLRGAQITGLAVALVLFFRVLTRGRLAETIVELMEKLPGMDYLLARQLYLRLIPSNMDVIIGATILLVMLLLFGLLLRDYARYLDEAAAGIDALVREDTDEIRLSPELEYVERELNAVRETLRRREQEARQAERQKDDLVVYLAHDIRTPLTSVLGYLSLLAENPELPEEQKRKYFQVARDKAERLEELVNEFFEIIRCDAQTAPPKREPVDLNCLIAQLGDELLPLLTERGKRLENLVPEGETVPGDGEKLARVFGNLLKNAVSYGAEGSAVRVTAERGPGRTLLFVESEGTVPEDKLETIFEKFCRLDSARSGDTGGAGLGLAIARELVRLHGGEIRAGNRDGRCVFTVELPNE